MLNLNKMNCEIIDIRTGVKRFADDEKLYSKALIEFACKNDDINNLAMTIETRDYKSAFIYAHTFKGLCGNLSLTRCYHSVCILTETLRLLGYIDDEKVLTAYESFKRSYIEAVSEIEISSDELIL